MFNQAPFEKINTYCDNHNVDSIEKKLLYAKFVEEYNDFRSESNNLTEESEKTLLDALLHDNALKKNLSIVKSEITSVVDEKLKSKERIYKIKNVGGTILLNIFSSFIFSAILLGLFILSESEIRPKIQQYLQPTSAEKTVEEK
jgi:predicted PurR-regulated permease PerM